MISKFYPVQGFVGIVALVVIAASSLTSSVNAAAAVSPARFARDDLPAPVIARFIEERDATSDLARVNSCTNSTADFTCLSGQGILGRCKAAHDPNTDLDGLIECLHISCPSTSQDVIKCAANSNTNDADESREELIFDPCTNTTSSGDITCLRSHFETCAIDFDPDGNADVVGLGQCMSGACPNVTSTVIGCISTNFGKVFS